MEVMAGQVSISNGTGTILIVLTGTPPNDNDDPLEDVINDFAEAVGRQTGGDIEIGMPYPVTVDGLEGLAVDTTGVVFGDPMQGQVIIIRTVDHRFFFAFAWANLATNENRWEEEGSSVFQAVLESVEFTGSTGTVTNTGPCPISTDETFGYTRENPIKVGGGAFGGPPREEAYLNNLRGPNGETLTYERLGSAPFGDTILDSYEIRGLAKNVILYLDEYAYTEPQAPVGFSCAGPFPLTAP